MIESKNCQLNTETGKQQRRQPESKIQARIIKKLEAQGFYVIKLMLTNKPGAPDMLVLKDGVASFIEVKRQGEELKPIQEYRRHELERFGFKCSVRTG